MTFANPMLTVTVQDWYNDPAIPDGDVKTFWVVAQGDPFGIWKSVQLSFTKDLKCWNNASDEISMNQTDITENFNFTSTTNRTFDISTWFTPNRTGCVISQYFVALTNSNI